MRYTPLATDALCPMPYALCPMPARAPHVTEKGYRKTSLCYFKSVEMLNLSVRWVVYYLKHKTVPLPPCIIP